MHAVLDVIVVNNLVNLLFCQLFEGPRSLTPLLSFNFPIVCALEPVSLISLEEVSNGVE